MENVCASDVIEQSSTRPQSGQIDAGDSSQEDDAAESGRWARRQIARAERKARRRTHRASLVGIVQLPSLSSLSPQYDANHHAGYLHRLDAATREPRNLNIALTGRYGAGKSSVLDKFQARRRSRTQRLAISTLAPGAPGDTTTNRIQKEIVKQLVYGASEKVGKSSRFNRIAVASKTKAAAQMIPLVVGVGALLFLFGWRPELSWGGSSDDPGWKKALAWSTIATVALGAATVLRLWLRGRSLADVKAAGAGIALTKDSETYFDEYLDEIVHYFDRESKDIVILEDLDRFDDPNILEALHELNLLLNETPKRRKKRRGNLAGRALMWVLSRRSGRAAVWFGVRADAFLPPRWADRVQGGASRCGLSTH